MKIRDLLDKPVRSMLEGNPVSSKLPGDVDGFLQDLSQEHGEISYNDIINFGKTATPAQIKRIRAIIKTSEQELTGMAQMAVLATEVTKMVKGK